MASKFTDRIGITKPPEVLQVSDMSPELKNSLWNVLLQLYDAWEHWSTAAELLAKDLFRERLDRLPAPTGQQRRPWVEEKYFTSDWGTRYNIIEFLVANHARITTLKARDGLPSVPHHLKSVDVAAWFNKVLEREMSGYRFVNGMLAPITSPSEIAEVQESVAAARHAGLAGASAHLSAAIAQLSAKPLPDLRNSIKESISAVESACKVLAQDERATLDKALRVVAEKTGMHGGLKSAFLSLYGYTSDEKGVRHAIFMDQPNVDFADAKYMLVACAAFVNFLIAKASAAGILPTK